MVWQYATEIFPTRVRNMGVGSCSFASRLGSVLAPFVGRELGAVSPAAPVVIFGVTSLVASGLTLLLPETRDMALPDTIQVWTVTLGQQVSGGYRAQTVLGASGLTTHN